MCQLHGVMDTFVVIVCPLGSNPQSSDFGDICALSSPFLVVVCVPVVVCVACKIRPCPSYSRRRDCINPIFLRSLDKGRGGGYLSVFWQGLDRTHACWQRTRCPCRGMRGRETCRTGHLLGLFFVTQGTLLCCCVGGRVQKCLSRTCGHWWRALLDLCCLGMSRCTKACITDFLHLSV